MADLTDRQIVTTIVAGILYEPYFDHHGKKSVPTAVSDAVKVADAILGAVEALDDE